MTEKNIYNFHTRFLIPEIQKLAFQIPRVQILGTNNCGDSRRTAFKRNILFIWVLRHNMLPRNRNIPFHFFPKKTFSMLHLSPFSLSLFRFNSKLCTWSVQSPVVNTQILVLGKEAELQKKLLKSLFVNKYMSLTRMLLLTASIICIYSLIRSK